MLEPPTPGQNEKELPYFVHESAYVDDGAEIGAGTKIWHFSHVMKGARIGERSIIGQNVNVDGGTMIGNNVKIQNNVSVYTGAVIEDDVFLGPSCVLTNVTNPALPGEPALAVRNHLAEARLHDRRECDDRLRHDRRPLCVRRRRARWSPRMCRTSRWSWATPARRIGWMSRHGHRLGSPDADGVMRCPESGLRYRETEPGILRCLDLDDEAALPAALSKGVKSYRQLREDTRHERSAARS